MDYAFARRLTLPMHRQDTRVHVGRYVYIAVLATLPLSASEAEVVGRGVSPVASLPPNTASAGAEAPAAVIRSATFRSLQREPGRINFAAHTLTGRRGSIFLARTPGSALLLRLFDTAAFRVCSKDWE